MFKFLLVDLRYLNSIAIRLFMIILSEILHFKFNIIYTDIDYNVITDGAKHLLQFESPYNRETYRYTPILAFLMIPNHIINFNVGKVIFSFVDVLVGLLIEILLYIQNYKASEVYTKNIYDRFINNPYSKYVLLYLYNPLTINICTRGSSDCIITFFVIFTLILIELNLFYLAAIIYGFAVHFKIYPIIYAPALYFYIATRGSNEQNIYNSTTTTPDTTTKPGLFSLINDIFYYCLDKSKRLIKVVFNYKSILFSILAIITFASILIAFYILFGNKFLYEYLIYHVVRKDHRHNYSMFYYLMYLTYNSSFARFLSFITFLPQALLILISSLLLYQDINLCLLINTFIFVTFNKVVTAQYFIWYISLLPLIAVKNKLFNCSKVKGLLLTVAWFFFELIWNYFSHRLEYSGDNNFLIIWLIDVMFFLVNCIIIREIINSHIK